jgi:hypothetical protein
MTSFDLRILMEHSGRGTKSAVMPTRTSPASQTPRSLVLIADDALEACGAFDVSFTDTPELAAAKALKRAALRNARGIPA